MVNRKTSDSKSTSLSPSEMFSIGEKVFVLHQDSQLMYEAKVLSKRSGEENKDEDAEDSAFFFVHYNGWKKKWDEWVPGKDVLAFTEANKKKAKQLQDARKMGKAKENDKRKSNNVLEKKKKKKKKTYGERELEDEDADEAEVRIPLTFTLKKQLVVDWERIVSKKRTIPLPRTPTVLEILDQFKDAKKKLNLGAISENAIELLCSGIAQYFDQALPRLLLYRFERPQYNTFFNPKDETFRNESTPNLRPSEFYGAEHLLRLFVKLPQLLVQTGMSSSDMENVQSKIVELAKYMALSKNYNKFFLKEYDDTTEEYQAEVKALCNGSGTGTPLV
eukprot:g3862.t1